MMDIRVLSMYDVRELLEVYKAMLEADRRNGSDFAQEQRDYILKHYPAVVLN
jgi:hypothetical protein